MKFKHELLPREELVDITNEKGRIYVTPIGNLPSVTTVIGRSMDKTGLIKWRENVGEDRANEILFKAQTRGTAIHNICEKYVMNDPTYHKGVMPTDMETFRQIKKNIDKHVDIIYGLELPLWSKVLQTAGKTDVIGRWDGKVSIIDYKTSLRHKTEKDCLGYMLQGTAYALMMYERYQLHVPGVVVIIAVDGQTDPIIYKVPTAKYWDKVKEIFITNRS